MICGSGIFHTAVFQSTLIVAVELKAQLQEETSLRPIMLRLDLLAVLEDSKQFSLRCIEAGETNIKGYLFDSMVGSQIDGLKHSLQQEELRELIVKATEDAMEICLLLLEKMHATDQGSEDQTTVDDRPEIFLSEDWYLLVSSLFASLVPFTPALAVG
jgi:hypothetical protein